MKLTILVVAVTCTLVPAAPTPPKAKQATTASVSNAALAAAGRDATLNEIDYGSAYCDGAMTVDAWLKALVGNHARAITWTGGGCKLVNDLNPIDAAKWPWCAQATVLLVRPKRRDDNPMVEIYFEKPDHGRPGAAYAFRSVMMTRDDGPDYLRFRKEFEAEWHDRFPPDPTVAACED